MFLPMEEVQLLIMAQVLVLVAVIVVFFAMIVVTCDILSHWILERVWGIAPENGKEREPIYYVKNSYRAPPAA